MILDELSGFARALRGEDRAIFEEMLKKPLKHFGSISYASSYHAWAFLLLAILLEQEKKLKEISGFVRCEQIGNI